ncbi:hypothetical protein PS918_02677 [Pseudomonas fluorescens]|uniref:Uncharacterized protein n=1 Tax=Pseudomonas fluorescens TaxID=294 RepID=A0A5E7SED3_PSEFL|nr:hypothetical protein PS918_02677 [Pseudomonas fluorescens]
MVPREGSPRIIQMLCEICGTGWYPLIDDSTFISI